MTFIESTFIPIPAEITLIPAGYLAHKGEMNFFLIFRMKKVATNNLYCKVIKRKRMDKKKIKHY
jgi:membrane protein YqaA with SNARE-associated domain